MAENNLIAYLKLDSKQFQQGATEAAKDMAKIGAAMAAIGTGVLIAAQQSAKYADEMTKAARASGTTVEEFSRFNYAAGLAGVSSEQLGQSLNKLNKPTVEAESAFRQMGVSMFDNEGKLKNQDLLLNDVADGMKKLNDPTSKTTAAMMIFGESGAKMVNMLNDGSAGLKNAAQEADAFGQVVSTQAGANAEKFNDNLAKLSMAAQGVNNVFSESVIQMVNTSGIMEMMQNSSKELIASWRGLSDDTKKLILQIGGAVTAFGVLLIGAAALTAILPSLIAGFTLLTGPIGLIVIAIGALTAAVTIYESSQRELLKSSDDLLKKFNDQNKTIEEAGAYYRQLEGHKANAAIGNANVRKSVEDLRIIAEKYNISLEDQAGNYRKISDVMDDMNAKRIKESQAEFISLSNAYLKLKALQDTETEMTLIGELEAMYSAKSLDHEEISKKYQENRLARLNEYTTKLREQALKIQELNRPAEAPKAKANGQTVSNQITTPEVLYKSEIISSISDIQKARTLAANNYKLTADQQNQLAKKAQEDQIKAIDGAQQLAIAYSKTTEAIAKTVANGLKPFGDMMDQINSGIAYRAQVAQRDLEVQAAKSAAAYEQQKADLTASEDAKIQTITDSYDAQIQAIKDGEDAKNNVMQAALAERLLMYDAEYQAQKDQLEREFQDQLDATQAAYELKRQTLEQDSADKEQAYLADNVLDADFHALQDKMQKDHLAKMSDFAKAYNNKITAEQKATDDKQKAQKVIDDAQIKALEQQKAAALVAANADKDAQLKALDNARSAQEKAEAKMRLQVQYDAEMDQYNNTLAIKIAATEAQGIAAAASAFASTAGALPFGLGVPIGLAIAAVIMGATQLSVANLIQQKPIKPAGLLMETGGVLSGPSHAGGGVAVTAEGGEGFIDKIRSQKLIQAVDNATSQPMTIHLEFHAGAFQVQDIRTDENVEWLADRLGRAIFNRVGQR